MNRPIRIARSLLAITLILPLLTGTGAAAPPLVSAGRNSVNVAQDGGFLWEAGRLSGTINRPPVGLLSGPSLISLDGGAEFALAVDQEGALWGWGSNGTYQLGDGTETSRSTPSKIGTANDWQSVSAQDSHSLAIKTDGTLWGWGMPYVGYESVASSKVPLRIGVDSNWKSFAAGDYHDLAIRQDGSLWAWGYNSHGHLGDGTTETRKSPVRVGIENNWASVSCFSHTSFALKTDGSLWVWGSGAGGLFGNGSASAGSVVPIQVGTANDWRQISGANGFVVAIKQDGSLWSWGSNTYGALGIGTPTTANIPTRVGTGTTWHTVAAGLEHAIAVQTDGSLWAWGYNYDGQLGVTGLSKSTTPLSVTHLYVPAPGIEIYLNGGWRAAGIVTPLTCKTGIAQEPTITTLPIRNKGLLPLILSEIIVPAGFSVVTVPAQVAALSGTDLQIRLNSSAKGSYSGVCRIRSNHPTVPEFTVNLTGSVVSPADDSDSDGLNDAAEVALAPLGFVWNSTQTSLVGDFFLKVGASGLHQTSEVQEYELHTPAPVVDSSSNTIHTTLGIRNLTDSSPVPLAPGNLTVLPDAKLGITLAVPAGRGFVRVSGVTPAE